MQPAFLGFSSNSREKERSKEKREQSLLTTTMVLRDHKPKGRGGAIIGKGHNSNIVYTVDDLPRVYAGFESCCFESELEVSKGECMTFEEDFNYKSPQTLTLLNTEPAKNAVYAAQTTPHDKQQQHVTAARPLSPRASDFQQDMALKYVASLYEGAEEVRNNGPVAHRHYAHTGPMLVNIIGDEYNVD